MYTRIKASPSFHGISTSF